jgi:hypothetical protein
MDSPSIHQVLTIYTWFGLAALLFLIALIGRKYEQLSKERTFYLLFALPVLAFAVAAVRQTQRDRVVGDAVGDVMLLVGGVMLAALCLHMYHLMTRG